MNKIILTVALIDEMAEKKSNILGSLSRENLARLSSCDIENIKSIECNCAALNSPRIQIELVIKH